MQRKQTHLLKRTPRVCKSTLEARLRPCTESRLQQHRRLTPSQTAWEQSPAAMQGATWCYRREHSSRIEALPCQRNANAIRDDKFRKYDRSRNTSPCLLFLSLFVHISLFSSLCLSLCPLSQFIATATGVNSGRGNRATCCGQLFHFILKFVLQIPRNQQKIRANDQRREN